jgi:hypothetical protein
MSSRRVWSSCAIALALLVAALSGCGLPSDGAPRTIAAEKVPFALLAPTSSIPVADQTGGPTEDLYYFDGAKLRAVRLSVPSRSPADVLGQLVKGVPEPSNGVATAIPKDTRVLGAEIDPSGVLVVTLSREILSIVDPDQGRAFGQLVWTATGLEGAHPVRFRTIDANGQLQDVTPTTDTGSRPNPLDRSDFRSIAPG